MYLNLISQYYQNSEFLDFFSKHQEILVENIGIKQLIELYSRMNELLEGCNTLDEKYQSGFQRVSLLQDKIENNKPLDLKEKMYVEDFLIKG